jgi:fucose permease
MLVRAVTFPIWLLYALTTVQRRAPEYVSTLLVAAAVSSLLLLYLDSHLNVHFREHEYLWGIPLFLLLVVVLVLVFTYRRHRRPPDDFDIVKRPTLE